ncbi:hypothetical protein FOA52_003621 [Chlamydomonas sp. UWO 241]|nr:hypothetical protein FOA52_003621 [Chlamydomonas sp. UWO 241]
MMRLKDEEGDTALMVAAFKNCVGAMELLLEHPSADGWQMAEAGFTGATALIQAAQGGDVDGMRLLLDHSSADPAAMLMQTDDAGVSALMVATCDVCAGGGYLASSCSVDAMRLLLNHPSADPAAMMAHADNQGDTAFLLAAWSGRVDGMRLLLDHPSANPASMMAHTDSTGLNALMSAARNGCVDVMRLLLDHPFADPASMMAVRNPGGTSISALTAAATWAARPPPPGRPLHPPACAPLLFLLRRVVEEESLPSDAEQAHMSLVMEALTHGSNSALFGNAEPDHVRDECVRVLMGRGGQCMVPGYSPAMSRIVRDLSQLARAPHLINEAVLGHAFARQHGKPRDDAAS